MGVFSITLGSWKHKSGKKKQTYTTTYGTGREYRYFSSRRWRYPYARQVTIPHSQPDPGPSRLANSSAPLPPLFSRPDHRLPARFPLERSRVFDVEETRYLKGTEYLPTNPTMRASMRETTNTGFKSIQKEKITNVCNQHVCLRQAAASRFLIIPY